jgi:hypothetical protein
MFPPLTIGLVYLFYNFYLKDFATKMTIEEWLNSKIPCEYEMEFALECGVLRNLDDFLNDLTRPRIYFSPYGIQSPSPSYTSNHSLTRELNSLDLSFRLADISTQTKNFIGSAH